MVELLELPELVVELLEFPELVELVKLAVIQVTNHPIESLVILLIR